MKRSAAESTIVHLVIALAILVGLFPIYWVLLTSLKIPVDIASWPPIFFPERITFDNYAFLVQEMNLLRFLRNSLLTAVFTTVICTVFGVPAAYAMSRTNTGGRPLSVWILMQRMLPPVTLAIPLFILIWRLGIQDSWLGLSLAHVSFNLPFTIWLMISFFNEVPMELEESGIVDGCTQLQTLMRITLPLAAPGMAAMAIFIAIQSWNEFLFAVILTNSSRSQTIPVVISTLITPLRDVKYGEMCAAAVVSMVPVFVFALLLQKYLVRGLTAGAVKG